MEWLTDASVNLLYLDLSRWQDIRVIDDERVADALRTLPQTQREGLGLNTGLSLARRAGAGRLVMGDLLKSGSRTTVIAKVYEVTSGRRLRSVSEEFASRDSTMPAYARLAGKVLDAPLPSSASSDAVGTRSLDAYQEYAAGLRALSAWQLADARRHFEHAIQIDTGFALSHYKLSIAIGWDVGFSPFLVQQAEAAARFASGLPARERALIRGQQQFSNRRYEDACETFRGLVSSDSTDVEAWYQVGECEFHNTRVEPQNGDSGRMQFVGSWGASYQAFQRTLVLDPTMHLAYEHLVDMLRSPYRGACLGDQCERQARALVEVRGDSVTAEAAEVTAPRQPFPPNPRENLAKGPRLRLAASIAQRWLASAPEEAEAHHQYGVILTAMSQFGDAARETATARRLGYRYDERPLQVSLLLRADSQYLRGAATAAALADSAIRFPSNAWQGWTDSAGQAFVGALVRADLASLIGSFARVPDRLPRSPQVHWDVTPGFVRTLAMLGAGVVPRDLDSVVARVASFRDTTSSARWFAPSALGIIGILCQGLCKPAGLDSSEVWRNSGFSMLARGDTAGTRNWLRTQDSSRAANEQRDGYAWPVGAFSGALLHVALSDTAGALQALDAFERWRMWFGPGTFYSSPTLSTVLGRAWLLHADLLQAVGRREEATLYYRRVADLWASGDPEIQPAVHRARSHLPENMQ